MKRRALSALLALALCSSARAEVVIDATGQSFASVQTRFYAALEDVLTQPNGSNCTGKLPLRVKLTGTARCTFADATDYGDVRACLALFASGPYSAAHRPTVAAKKFNPVPRGGLVIDLDGFHLEFDAERGGAQTEAVAGLMIGSGYMAGYVGTCSGGRYPGDDCAVDADCGSGGACAEGTKNMQWGAIPGLRIVGNATIHATAVRSGGSRQLESHDVHRPVDEQRTRSISQRCTCTTRARAAISTISGSPVT